MGNLAGREPYAGGSIYRATKHDVRAFSGALLREVVDTPIRVTEIQPGAYSCLTLADKQEPLTRLERQVWLRPSSRLFASVETSPLPTRSTRVSNHVRVT